MNPTDLPDLSKEKMMKSNRGEIKISRSFFPLNPNKNNDYFHVSVVVGVWGIFSKFWSVNFGFPAVGFRKFWFRKVREVGRIHFHLFWYLYVSMVPSYDQKTRNVHDYQIHDY